MLESISVRRHHRIGDPLNLGLLAEALLFYGKVRLIADYGVLQQLAKSMGPETLVEYVTSGRLSFTYVPNQTAVMSEGGNNVTGPHGPIVFTMPGRWELQHAVPQLFEASIGRAGRARRLARRLVAAAEEVSLDDPEPRRMITEAFDDPSYLNEGVRFLFREYMPEYPRIDEIRFEAEGHPERLTARTNINFAAANAIYSTRIPATHSTVSPAMLLAELMVHDDLYFAARYGTELATTDVRAQLMNLRVQCATERQPGGFSIGQFQEITLGEVGALAEAINSGRRSFQDLLRLLDQAERFRTWVRGHPPDVNLMREYYKEATKDSFVDQLPVKVVRWLFCTGIGATADLVYGTAAGATLGLIDAFIIDKLSKGWTPRQFVESHLKRFVEPT